MTDAIQYVHFLSGRAEEMKRPGLVSLCNRTLDTLSALTTH